MLNNLLEILMPFIIGLFMILIVWKMIKNATQGVVQRRKVDIQPTSVGDRLKKYLVKSGKANPKTARILKIRRTKYNEGGKVGYVHSAVPTRDCTRFIFKTGIMGFKKVLYCPSSLHSSLHYKEVFIDAVSLENAGGFYYPIPYKGMSNTEAFTIANSAFKIDLKKMQVMDVHQLEIEQIYSSIAGTGAERELTHSAPEDIEYQEVKEDDTYAH